MSPRTEKQLEELREQRREDIMEAAIELFAHRGYDATSISQIAKKAGISKGLIYNYFDTKQALLDELIRDSLSKLSYLFQPREITAENAGQILWKFLTEMKQSVNREPEYWNLYTQLGVQLIDYTEQLEERFADELAVYNRNVATLLKHLQPEVKLQTSLAMFNATLDGVILHHLMNPHFPTDAIYERFYEQITGSKPEGVA
jgi:AcrR family transcriptional regulator